MHSSDFILVVMTIVRFQIVNSAHQYKASMPGGAAKYHCYTIFAFMLSLLLNLPHMVHYKIVECPEIENCWTIEQSDVAESIFWKILGYLTVFVAKILPLFIITIVDIIIFVKIKVRTYFFKNGPILVFFKALCNVSIAENLQEKAKISKYKKKCWYDNS